MAHANESASNGNHKGDDETPPIVEAMSDAIDGMASSIGDPAEWPEMAEDFARSSYQELLSERWRPAVYAAGGSLVTLVGAVLVARRRSAKHSGLMAAAMPMMAAAKPMMAAAKPVMVAMESQIADASEQMIRSRTKCGSGRMRTLMTLGLFALTGWGIRRAMAQMS
jgi:hypothetical protein